MPDSYRESRVPLVERAKKIGETLKQKADAEVANAQQTVRAYEDQTRSPGTAGQYPVADEVRRLVGPAIDEAVADLNRLAQAMTTEETWSKDDAERRLAELNAARVGVEAIPSRTWTRFVAGLGSSILISASALLGAEEARIWPSLPNITDWSFYLPPALVYSVGGTVLVVSLYYWSLDDAERRLRYEEDIVDIPDTGPGWATRLYGRIVRKKTKRGGRKRQDGRTPSGRDQAGSTSSTPSTIPPSGAPAAGTGDTPNSAEGAVPPHSPEVETPTAPPPQTVQIYPGSR